MTRPFQSLESVIREHLARKDLHEADNVGERGVIASTDTQNVSTPTETAPDKKNKKKKEDAIQNDPNTIEIGKTSPIDLAPTTDDPKITDLVDKKDKKIVEEKEKTLGKGIHYRNYHNHIRKEVMRILSANQNLADKHEIRPRGDQKNEEKTSQIMDQSKKILTQEIQETPIIDQNRNAEEKISHLDERKDQTAEDERVSMYHRAGNAEATKKHRKEKIVHRTRQTINGIRLRQRKIKEETIDETSDVALKRYRLALARRLGIPENKIPKMKGEYKDHEHIPIAPTPLLDKGKYQRVDSHGVVREDTFDPFAATGQLISNIIKTIAQARMTHNKRAKNSQYKNHPHQTQKAPPPASVPPIQSVQKPPPTQSALPPQSGQPSVQAPAPKPKKPKSPTVSYKIGQKWKPARQKFRNKAEANAFILSALKSKGAGSGVTWRINEGMMKRWLMDMEYHADTVLQAKKGDRKAAKQEFLKKFPNQGHVFDNHMKANDEYNSGQQQEETINELYGKGTDLFNIYRHWKDEAENDETKTSAEARTKTNRAANLINRGRNYKNWKKNVASTSKKFYQQDLERNKKEMSEETINEISKRRALDYIGGAVGSVANKNMNLGYEIGIGKKDEKRSEKTRKLGNRQAYISIAANKLAKKWVRVPATEEVVMEAKRAGLTPRDTGDQHIINQLRTAQDFGTHSLRFKDNSTLDVDRATADKILDKYEGLRTSIDKESMTNRLWASKQSFNDYMSGKPETVQKSGPSMPFGFVPKGLKAGKTGASRNPSPLDHKIAKPFSSKELEDKGIKYREGEKDPKFWT